MADRQSHILDHRGERIRVRDLTREVAAPANVGIRQVWDATTVASGLTPDRLATLLSNAAQGDHDSYLTLAMEMEERDLHYYSVLQTRRLSVSGIDVVVDPASEDGEDDITQAVQQLVRGHAFSDLLDDCLDALGKGFAVTETMWDRGGSQWWPVEWIWRDQRHFVWGEDGRTVRLRDMESPIKGIALPAYKFVVHQPRIKAGLPIRRGLARLASVAYMCKAYSITDWVAFSEVFGMPLRIGRYSPSATESDINTLIAAVANLGTDAAAVLPQGMEIDFNEPGNRQGAADLFKGLAEYMDRQMSKAVLGQTASTEGTAGKLGNEDAQDEVRRDLKRADAKQLAATINRDVIRPFVDLNFGPQPMYPQIRLPVHEPEDVKALVDSVERLVPQGFRVKQSQLRGKLGLDEPEDGDEILQAPAPMAPGLNSQGQPCPGCGQVHGRAANRETPADAGLEDIAGDAVDDWRPQLEPNVDAVRRLAETSNSFEDFRAGLGRLLADGDMDAEEIVDSLAESTFKARGMGDGTDETE